MDIALIVTLLDPLVALPMLALGLVLRRWGLLGTPVYSWVYAVAVTGIMGGGDYVPDRLFIGRWIAAGAYVLVGHTLWRVWPRRSVVLDVVDKRGS